MRGAEDALGTLLGGDFLPSVKVFVGGFDGLRGHFRSGVLEDADDLRGARGIRGVALVLGGDLLAAEPNGVLIAEFGGHFFQGVLHARAVFGLGKIDEGFVGELRDMNFLFGGGHGGFLPWFVKKQLYCVRKRGDKQQAQGRS